MAFVGVKTLPICLICFTLISMLMMSSCTVHAHGSPPEEFNVIDKCWRTNPHWRKHRHHMATCSVGYAGKMIHNIGAGVISYKVTDPGDDGMNPKPGTLRYAMTNLQGKVWITFQRDMSIKLARPLLVNSFTTIDARGVNVEIAHGACLLMRKVNNVIIHGLQIHHCQPQPAGPVRGPNGKIVELGPVDADAMRMLTANKIWIDHNTLYDCADGLIDVTRGSTDITISNNWFKSQDKVMLLGHDDGFLRDRNMKVTVVFNHFGPRCNQRMPRVRHGYAHVVNNMYQGWGNYAIGGSMNPSIKSQANLFIAPEGGNKEITWRQNGDHGDGNWNLQSVEDAFENGASFQESGEMSVAVKPNYNPEQQFPAGNARTVRQLTQWSGALRCPKVSGSCMMNVKA